MRRRSFSSQSRVARATLLFAAVCACTGPRDRQPHSSDEPVLEPARAGPSEPEVTLRGPDPGPKFELVAYRSGDIRLQRAWDDDGAEHVVLVAALPYPFVDHAVEALPEIYTGLLPPRHPGPEPLYGNMAGVVGDSGVGWLSLQGGWATHERHEIPRNYEWQPTGGWRVLRERRGGLTQVHSGYLSRGSSVFAETQDIRLTQPTQIVVGIDGLARAARPRLVRLRGELPVPDLPTNELDKLSWATTATGELYVIADPSRLGNERRRIELLDWSPTTKKPRATPLPDVAAVRDEDKRLRSNVQVKATDDGVLISGNFRIADHPTPVAYLAVGPPEALTRLPLECEGRPCTGSLTSAEIGPDQDYWLAIDGGLYSRDPGGRLRAIPIPDLEQHEPAIDLREWCWAGGWTLTDNPSGEFPAKLEQIERMGDDLWLRLVVPDYGGPHVVALFKTGPAETPVRLPCDGCVRGELFWRESPPLTLRLFDVDDHDQLRDFIANIAPRLRARDEVIQICEVKRDGQREVVAFVNPEHWQENLRDIYAALIGHAPVEVSGPLEIVRVLGE